MARFVKFAGGAYVPGKFTLDGASWLSTEDINILDADTAHNFQSIGAWANISGAELIAQQAVAAAFSGFGIRLTQDGAVAGIGARSQDIPVTASTAVVTSRQVVAGQPGLQSRIRLERRSAGGSEGFVNGPWTPLVVGVPTVLTVLDTGSVATDAYRIHVNLQKDDDTAAPLGDYIDFYDSLFALGSDPTFVPSLRVVGTLFEEKDDAALPVVFAADGTPLTVGVGFAGDATLYRRFDGADNTAPNVASVNPNDYPGAPGAIPDATEWVGADGRTWKANGTVVFVANDFGDSVYVPRAGLPDAPFIVLDPPGMSSILDDNFWVVGSGWVGDGFTATMHDGIDATGPIVAQFSAADIGI